MDKPQNYIDLYGIVQLLQGSHLNNFLLKTVKLGWVAFHSVTFQLKCFDFQSNQYKKLVPVLSRFCSWLYMLKDACLKEISSNCKRTEIRVFLSICSKNFLLKMRLRTDMRKKVYLPLFLCNLALIMP